MGAFNNDVQGVEEIEARLVNTTATDVVDGTDGAYYVPWFSVQENAGGTPTLNVVLTDGTKVRYLGAAGVTYRAKALTANQSVLFDQGYAVPVGWTLQITSGDPAGKLDVVGLKVKRVPG